MTTMHEVARSVSGRKTHLRLIGSQYALCGVRVPIRGRQDSAVTCKSCQDEPKTNEGSTR